MSVEYYLRANPDVANAARRLGKDPKKFAKDHYLTFGKKEGRRWGAPRPEAPSYPEMPSLPVYERGPAYEPLAYDVPSYLDMISEVASRQRAPVQQAGYDYLGSLRLSPGQLRVSGRRAAQRGMQSFLAGLTDKELASRSEEWQRRSAMKRQAFLDARAERMNEYQAKLAQARWDWTGAQSAYDAAYKAYETDLGNWKESPEPEKEKPVVKKKRPPKPAPPKIPDEEILPWKLPWKSDTQP